WGLYLPWVVLRLHVQEKEVSMCGPLFLGFWWIFALVGFLMCLGFMAFRFLGTGRGFMCMGGHQSTPTDQVTQSHS
ncbi:MAG TPA: hypothetical protein VEL51_09770, partial [Vicinamibacterales bacterium]|nr:hypothetical protein [Vicinamibacterales bacterium]